MQKREKEAKPCLHWLEPGRRMQSLGERPRLAGAALQLQLVTSPQCLCNWQRPAEEETPSLTLQTEQDERRS